MLLDRSLLFFGFILFLNLIPFAVNIVSGFLIIDENAAEALQFAVVTGFGDSNLDFSSKPAICISNSTTSHDLQLRYVVFLVALEWLILTYILSDVRDL